MLPDPSMVAALDSEEFLGACQYAGMVTHYEYAGSKIDFFSRTRDRILMG